MNNINERQEEFWFTLIREGDLRKTWKPQIEIIFMLKGTGRIYFADIKTMYTVQKEDIFVINRFEVHHLELEENAVALSFSVSLRFISAMCPEMLKYSINCRSFFHDESKQDSFDLLRSDLAKAFKEQYKNLNQPLSYFKSKAAAILEDLSQYFLDRKKTFESVGCFESLKPAVDYIQFHYRENITLEDLADQTFLSKTYISRSFTRCFGISFTDYITLLRVAHAAQMLQGTSTISEIAMESGFPNVNAMILAFKRHRGSTPSAYRKKQESPERINETVNAFSEDEIKDDFDLLMKYAAKTIEAESASEEITEIHVDMQGRKRKVDSHWKRLLNAGYARSVTDGTIQKEIRYLQDKVGFEYIRIKGILNDDMCVLKMDINGKTNVSFAYVDEVIDFLLSAGAKPMIEIGLMPRLLAKTAAVYFTRDGVFDIPSDIKKWRELIELLMEHLVKRYGSKTVRKWLFAPWITPDFMEHGLCSPEEYEEIYQESYFAIKKTNPDFVITGPGCTGSSPYFKWFLNMCKRRNCMPDIITFRSFAEGQAKEENGLILISNNESFSMAVSGDENIIGNTVCKIRKSLDEMGLTRVPLILEEWSNNIWQRDLCNDSCYKSAYLFKNILENHHHLNAMGYFSLNDRLDEVSPATDTFHGGFGLFTKNDIPKSACRALELLGQMGDRLVQKGDGYYITRAEDEIQIFLYHYSHYDLLYRYRHMVNLSRTNREDVFITKESRAFFIRLKHMQVGKYEVRRYAITKEGGSSYDMWVKMGAQEPLTKEEVEMLQILSVPLYRREFEQVREEEGILNIKASLKPQDVCLIKIKIL